MKPQAKGSGIVSETQKSRLTLGESKFQSKMPVIESSGPPQRCTFRLQPKGVRGMLLLIPLGFAVNTERETDPVSILFHVFPQGPATLGF